MDGGQVSSGIRLQRGGARRGVAKVGYQLGHFRQCSFGSHTASGVLQMKIVPHSRERRDGFIMAALVEVKKKIPLCEVSLYYNLSTGFRCLAQGFELLEGDIADEARLRPVLARVDAVMHFAAHAYVGESVENPRKYFQNNVIGALSLLNSALDGGIRRFVFSSTCAVYGDRGQ